MMQPWMRVLGLLQKLSRELGGRKHCHASLIIIRRNPAITTPTILLNDRKIPNDRLYPTFRPIIAGTVATRSAVALIGRILPDHQEVLARRTVEARVNLAHAAVRNADPLDDLKPERV